MKYINENPNAKKSKIVLMGIGGAGNNAINRVFNNNPNEIEFIAVNTAQSELALCNCENKLLIGEETFKGLGVERQVELGRNAAQESAKEIQDALEGVDILILRCGFGGGTGTGATPIITHIAKQMGILTIVAVTQPFEFEDLTYLKGKNVEMQELEKEADILLVVSNQMILKTVKRHTTLPEALDKIEVICWNMINQAIEDLRLM